MPRKIGITIAFFVLAWGAVPGAQAEGAPPNAPPSTECRKVDRCIPTRDELDGKAAAQDLKTKTRHDTVKNSINNVR